MSISIQASGASCGATVTGIDLSQPLNDPQRLALAEALLIHKVLAFSNQSLDDDALERASLQFGPFGVDEFIQPIEGHEHIIAVCRSASETAPIFAEAWHTDWSFQANPPAATCLYGITIPPVGGHTMFANQVAAAANLPAALRNMILGKQGIHSAKMPYSKEGLYGDADRASDRSMDIRADVSADATQLHPLLSKHPLTGEERLFGCIGYLIGIEGMPEDEALNVLLELHAHQTQETFVYSHEWQPGTLLVWDNRSVLHRATGGYEGHDRLLHRTTVKELTAVAG